MKRRLRLVVDNDRRPQTRGECVNGVRPCPWVSCRMHLYLDVHPSSGTIKFNGPHRDDRVEDLFEMSDTCALDVADRGESILDASGKILNVTREAIRQLEKKAKAKFRKRADHRLHALMDAHEHVQGCSPLALAQDRAEE